MHRMQSGFLTKISSKRRKKLSYVAFTKYSVSKKEFLVLRRHSFFGKNFVKETFLLKKKRLLKNRYDEFSFLMRW